MNRLTIAMCIGLVATTARSAQADDEQRDEARALATQGDEAFVSGRCGRALELWRRAEARYHAPTLLLRIARCQALVGQVVAAARTLDALAAEALPDDAPEPFFDARRRAREERDGVRARIATLVVRVDGARAGSAAVRVDGRLVIAGESVELDPGRRTVAVSVTGVSWTREVELAEGERRELSVAVSERARPAPSRTQRDVALVVGGVGLVGLTAGAVFGAVAVAEADRLGRACGSGRDLCPKGMEGDIARQEVLARVSDASFIAGAALTIGGATLWLTRPEERRGPPTVKLSLVGSGARLGGRF